jgi:hypothetical protein
MPSDVFYIILEYTKNIQIRALTQAIKRIYEYKYKINYDYYYNTDMMIAREYHCLGKNKLPSADLAHLLFSLFDNNKIICSSIRKNTWYQLQDNGMWHLTHEPVMLYNIIHTKMCVYFNNKAQEFAFKYNNCDKRKLQHHIHHHTKEGEFIAAERCSLKGLYFSKMRLAIKFFMLLRHHRHKKKIINECKYLYYDEGFPQNKFVKKELPTSVEYDLKKRSIIPTTHLQVFFAR